MGKYKAQENYDRANTRSIMLKLNKKTDADILAKLDSVQNRQGYIKQLIRIDIGSKKERIGGEDVNDETPS